MEGLPKLPGYNFRDLTQSRYHVSQQFTMRNGYLFPKNLHVAVGGGPVDADGMGYAEEDDLCGYDSTLTYGRMRAAPTEPFIPHYVRYDMKCLTFKAFFKQSVCESPLEHYRVRYVNIAYFLEDDSITVIEPPTKNAGTPQGRMVRRGKIPKNEMGDTYTWKDLNLGYDIAIYGKVYHIYDCDAFTREFLLSQGVELGEREQPPVDPHTHNRQLLEYGKLTRVTPICNDKLRRFLEFDGKVLKFDAVWDDRDTELGDVRKCQIYYYLRDDTISVKEQYERNCGRDPVPSLLKKTKVPKNFLQRPADFPAIYCERQDSDVFEYLSPRDLLIGDTIFIFNRRFFLYDCDAFTRNYFLKILNIEQKPRIDALPVQPPPEPKYIPPHIMVGVPEDTIQSCYTVTPKAPKIDAVKYMVHATKAPLRWECVMEWIHPEDAMRKFVINYYLRDSKIKITESFTRNSGMQYGMGNTFLKSMNVPKPGSNRDNPDFYSPADFDIGSIVEVFSHRFRITGADLYVYRYMCENPEKFTQKQINNMRDYQTLKGNLQNDLKDQMIQDCKDKQLRDMRQLSKEVPPKPPAIDECFEAVGVKQRPAEEPDEEDLPTIPTDMSYAQYRQMMRLMEAQEGDSAEMDTRLLEERRRYENECAEPPPRYGIHVKQDCPYVTEPPRPYNVKLEEEKKTTMPREICPEAPETFASMPICPEPIPKPIPPPNPCDKDRSDKPPTLLDMKYRPKDRKVQFAGIEPFKCDTELPKSADCCCK